MRRLHVPGRTAGIAGLASASILVFTGCGGPGGTVGGQEQDDGGRTAVVTSTNVYGDIVEAIGGDRVEVTPIVTRLSQDPHSYVATARDKLAVSKADLVVENGGGYDPFLQKLAGDVGLDDERLLTAVEVAAESGAGQPTTGESGAGQPTAGESGAAESGAEQPTAGHTAAGAGRAAEGGGDGHGEINEHVWYDLHAMGRLADAVAAALSGVDAEGTEDFTGNAADFKAGLGQLEDRLAGLRERSGGVAAAVTEPVPLYLIEDAGVDNATPPEFSEAIEEGADVPPTVMREMRELLSTRAVAFLAYNEQTEGPQTQAVRRSADEAGITVANFTETLPEGQTYLTWMEGNIDTLEGALDGQ